jgi:hypothetical protein
VQKGGGARDRGEDAPERERSEKTATVREKRIEVG